MILFEARPGRRRYSSTRRILAALATVGVLAGSLIIASAAASHPSFLVPLAGGGFPGWLAGPFKGTGPTLSQTGFELLVVAMCLCYAASLWLANAVPRALVIGTILAAHVVFLLGPPLLSPDVATYLAYARLGVLHGLSPYTHAAHALPITDPLHPWVTGQAGATDYGPPFTLLTYALAHLSVSAAVWTLKVLTTVASLATVGLAASCARRRDLSAARAAVLVGLNPIALIYAVGGDHNDLLMMAVLMLGIWLALRRRPMEGSVAGVVATALKVSAAPATLFMILGAPRWRRTAAAAIVAVVILALIVLAAVGHPSVFVDYARQLYHAGHAFARRYSVPALIGQALGLGGTHGVTQGVRIAADLVLVGWIVALLAQLRRAGDWLTLAGWGQLALLITTTWLWPWYIVWILPLAAVSRDRRLVWGSILMTAFLVATQVFLPLG